MSAIRSLGMLCAGLSALALASPAFATDLLRAYRLAQQNDPEYAAARFDYEAAIEARPQARAALLPQIGFSYSRSEDDQEDRTAGSENSFTTESHELNLRQTLFDWEQFAGVGRADAEVARAEAELADADQALILRVAERYFDVLSAEANARFARAELEAIERQRDQARERFDVGLIPVTDVKAAQASYDLAVSRQIEAQNDVADAREALRAVIERRAGTLARLQDELPLDPPEPANPDRWVEQAREQNPEYLAARASAEAARQGIRQARAGHYPEIDLVVSRREIQTEFTAGIQQDQRTDSIGVEVSIPIFSGGAVSSRGREARSNFEASQSRVVEARRAVEQRTRDAFRGLRARISQVRALRQAVESNEAAVEATEAGFRVGTRTGVDVLDALRDLFEAERDFATARFEYILNRLRLQEAAGTLTVDQLRAVNTWLTEEERS